jgi:hypothetical protein
VPLVVGTTRIPFYFAGYSLRGEEIDEVFNEKHALPCGPWEKESLAVAQRACRPAQQNGGVCGIILQWGCRAL